MMGGWLILAAVMAANAGPVAQKASRVPAASSEAPMASVYTVTVTPGSVSFSATDPDLGVVTASPPTTVSWRNNGNRQRTWSLRVASLSSGFGSCPNLPVSAVTVQCTGVTAGGNATGACGPAITLSTTPQTVASGRESNQTVTYTVTLNLSLTESWRYIAHTSPSCSLSLTYNAVM